MALIATLHLLLVLGLGLQLLTQTRVMSQLLLLALNILVVFALERLAGGVGQMHAATFRFGPTGFGGRELALIGRRAAGLAQILQRARVEEWVVAADRISHRAFYHDAPRTGQGPRQILRLMRKSLTLLWLLSPLAVAQPGGLEIPNLDISKKSIRTYHESGRYAQEVDLVAQQALSYLQANLPRYQGQNPAIVLDIDETTLTNYSYFDEYDFAYLDRFWAEWVKQARAPALAGPQRLFNWARDHQVAVFFITGRGERDRQSTERNLEQAGYAGWKKVILRAPGTQGTTGSYKAAERQRLTEAGYSIVLNMGDQSSDLEGGYNGAAFKLPNPMYYVP